MHSLAGGSLDEGHGLTRGLMEGCGLAGGLWELGGVV